LNDASARSVFTLLLNAPGVQIEPKTDRGWLIKDSQGNQLWQILAPTGIDANGVPAPLAFAITPEDSSRYRMDLSVDPAWLAAPERAFPVILDPSLADTQYFGGETYVQSTSPNLPSYKQRNRFIGKSTYVGDKGITRVYAPVDLSFLPVGITAAQLGTVEVVFTQYVSERQPNGFNTSVYPVASTWSDQTLTWNNQPPAQTAIANGVLVSAAIGPKHWDITNWAKQVRAGSLPNNGLMIRADDETQGGGIFWSSQCDTLCPASDRPYIQVQMPSDSLIFGDGRDNDLTVPTGTTALIDTVSTAVSATGTAATVANPADFDVGDLVLFHQTQGTANVGRWEFSRIIGISGTNWTLDVPLVYAYDSVAGKAQAIKVPQYQNVTVESGATLSAPAWNGTTGGILVLKVADTINSNAGSRIGVTGFRGGSGGHRLAGNVDPERHGWQGEGRFGIGGRSAASNDAGGGAGQADLPVGDGGGGGGGGSHAVNGQNGTIEPIHQFQDYGRGATITYGADDITTADFGGGGGGAGSDDAIDAFGGGGGGGGGIILAYGAQFIGNGLVDASGSNGGSGVGGGQGAGGGGGGAGGVIKIVAMNVTNASLQALGGAGGSPIAQSGIGGAGGAGRIRIEYCNSIAGIITVDPPTLPIQVGCDPNIDSDFNPQLDTYSFANRAGAPSFQQFVADYGLPATTHIVTETRVLQVISSTTSLTLPISFAPAVLTATLAFTPTAGLTSTAQVGYIPRPISYLYEETVVKALYDDQFTQAYAGALKGGLCAGMASTVADFARSQHLGTNVPVPSAFGGTDTVRGIPNQQSIQDFIQRYHGRQVDSGALNWMAEQGSYKANDLYNHLRARLSSPDWWNDPEIVGIIKGANCTDIEIGHALLPYKIVQQTGNHAFVYVYDSNYPPTSADDASNRFIDFDLTSNTWAYQMAPGVIWSGPTIYSIPLGFFRGQPVLPTQSDTDVMMVDGVHGQAWGVHGRAWGGYKWTFGVHGRAWGDDTGPITGCYVTDTGPTFVQEISRTMRVTPFTGLNSSQTFPDTLFFPAQQNWRFTGTGASYGNIGDMLLFGPHSAAGFLTTASDTSKDSVDIDASFRSLTLHTNDPSKPITAYQMHETDTWTRVYPASNTMLGTTESMTLTVSPSLDQFEVINHAGVAKTLDVGFAHIGSDGIGTIVYPHQSIGPNERRIYTPLNWLNLSHSAIRVDIDANADGAIDRTDWIAGDVFPAAVALRSVPNTPGQSFPIIDRTVAPRQYGWINLDYPLPPRATPKNAMRGNERVLRKWLQFSGNPGLQHRGGFVGVEGRHGDLANDVGYRTARGEAYYHAGDVMIVPLYDRIVQPTRSRPLYYRIVGYAVVRILGIHPNDRDTVRGQLLAKVVY
jgi:hypothetical protein